jgi:flap endonuclease-1
MGIKQLMQLLSDKAPDSYKTISMEQLSGRVLALDASIAIYQFLIST